MNIKDNAKYYNDEFGFNVLPLNGKLPAMESWKKWQVEIESESDLDLMNWETATGLGGVSGVDDLRVLDIDYAVDSGLIGELLSVLGLPKDYKWCVKSGSGKGFHIWFLMKESESLIGLLGGDKSVYKLRPNNKKDCDHYEIRWKNCQTALPPSLHKSGNRYEFMFGSPRKIPNEINIKRIELFIKKFIKIKDVGEVKRSGVNKKNVDKKELERAVEVLSEKLPESSYDEWVSIGFALASVGEEGREYFVKMSLLNPNYNDSEEVINKKFDGLIKDYNGKITLGTLFSIASEYGYKRLEPKFWREGEGKIKIDQEKYIRFLTYHGFGKLQNGDDKSFVKVNNNIAKRVTTSFIKDYVINYVNSLPYDLTENCKNRDLLSTFMSERNKLFGESFLEFLKTLEINFKRDKADCGYSYFKNCYVEITANEMRVLNYSELDGIIWEEQVKKYDFYIDSTKIDFSKFISNVCRGEVDRINALHSAIGYLQHNYKDANNAKAICFIDERISGGASGRSGKGIVGTAIENMCIFSKIDGRNFKFDNSFAFQSVSLNTEVLYFEDVKKKFGFDKLFSIITDGIVVEKKNKDSFYIPFERSPKILITTNYSLDGADDSSLDRQFVVEFSDHYNMRKKPIDDFGKLFFSEWSDNEWNLFYNFMLSCLQYYLKNGLVKYNHINLLQKQLIDATSLEFYEFMQDIALDKEYEKKRQFEKFKEENTDFHLMKQNTFTSWLKKYANLKVIKINERRSGANKYFTLSNFSDNSSKVGQTEVEELLI